MDFRMMLAERLLEWFEENHRKFPWREKRNPYEILVAEMMLQRTKAEQVVPVYLSFLERYPDYKKLSGATLDDLRDILRPLGLSWRAEKIFAMSRYLFDELNGVIPDEREELLKIPGVGDYVADAILSFGFGKNRAVLDSNVVRVLKRYYGMESHTEARRDKKFRKKIDEILPESRVKEFNWAILDFAATVCKPQTPLHEICPIRAECDLISST